MTHTPSSSLRVEGNNLLVTLISNKIMTLWHTDLSLWSWGSVTLFAHQTLKLLGQGQQTSVQGLPALYITDLKSTQSDFLFSTTHLLQLSGQRQAGMNRNLPPTVVSRHLMRSDVSTRRSRERAHGSLGAELVIPAAAHWI